MQPYSLDHALASGPFETQTRLTQIAMAVPVEGMIADMVCPRVRTAYKFTYFKHTTADRLTIPDVRASRAGELNEAEFGGTDETDSTAGYGLIAPVPHRDIEEARAQQVPFDPLANATTMLASLVKLGREKRVVDLVFGALNYAAGMQATLAGDMQWSHKDSDPLAAIMDAMDSFLVRPNMLVLGRPVWTKLRRHPKIVEAVKATGAGGITASGVVGRQAVADLFEIGEILVGETWANMAAKGQAPDYARLWGKHAALLHIEKSLAGGGDQRPTFCFTADAMPMMTGTYDAPGRGVGTGSTVVKVSEECKELSSWQDVGYFFQNAVG